MSETMSETDFLILASPGAIVVTHKGMGRRVGALIEVEMSNGTKIGGVALAFYSADRKRTTYRKSVGAIIRPTTYGHGYWANDGELVDVCWEI